MTIEETIRDAKKYLSIASALLHNASLVAEPFRYSKFLNTCFKEVQQINIEICGVLGDIKIFPKNEYDFEKMPSLALLLAMKRDGEVPLNKPKTTEEKK